MYVHDVDWNNHRAYSIGGYKNDIDDRGVYIQMENKKYTDITMTYNSGKALVFVSYIDMNINVYTLSFLTYRKVCDNSIHDISLMNKQ